jgi:hypothetical protein
MSASATEARAGTSFNSLFAGVDRIIERTGSLQPLFSHRLELLAVRSWRAQGRPVPHELLAAELRAMGSLALAETLLTRVSAVLDQDAIVLKGIAVAELYPDRYLRPFGDLDLLVADTSRAQQQLLEAGFRPIATQQPATFFARHRHEQPLELPGYEGVNIEIHSRPPWVHWARPPSFEMLATGATPTRWDRVSFPPTAAHAAILAAHAWEAPSLRRISDLLDVELMRLAAGGAPADHAAAELGIGRLWQATRGAAAALFHEERAPLSLRTWGRDLLQVRSRSLLDDHLRRLLAPFWQREPLAASGDALHALMTDLRPIDSESWSDKLARVSQGIRHPFDSVDSHNARLGDAAQRLRTRPRGRGN